MTHDVPKRAALKAVLFDWDGTLCDSAAASLRAFEKSMADHGVRFTHEAYLSCYSPDWYCMYRTLGLPDDLWLSADARWLDHFAEEHPMLFDGALETLDELRRGGLQLGIVSSGTRSRIERELERMEIASHFGALVCNEDVARRKPHPEGLERALAALGRIPGECCYVGDTPEDVSMGRAAGMLTVAMPSDYIGAGRAAECRADLTIARIGDLPAALDFARRE